MIGAYATAIISGSILSDGALVYSGPGDPLSAFIAALAGIAIGSLPAGKTKLDLLITPAVTIITGGAAGIIVGPPISAIMTKLGDVINWGTVQQPLIMGVVVSVIMGMVLTLPISSAALGIILGRLPVLQPSAAAARWWGLPLPASGKTASAAFWPRVSALPCCRFRILSDIHRSGSRRFSHLPSSGLSPSANGLV